MGATSSITGRAGVVITIFTGSNPGGVQATGAIGVEQVPGGGIPGAGGIGHQEARGVGGEVEHVHVGLDGAVAGTAGEQDAAAPREGRKDQGKVATLATVRGDGRRRAALAGDPVQLDVSPPA